MLYHHDSSSLAKNCGRLTDESTLAKKRHSSPSIARSAMAMEMQKPKGQELPIKTPMQKPSPVAEKPLQNPSSHPSNEATEPKQGEEEEVEEEEEEEPKPPSAEIASTPPVSNVQKKILRAERFGVPVQLSEEEKRNSRAERFGTGSTLHSHRSEETGKSEEQKRKARAERFGLTVSSTVEEEAKKKAKFAPNSKPDTLEEDKRKARAIRFSQTSLSTPTQSNGKSNELVGRRARRRLLWIRLVQGPEHQQV